MEEKTLSFGLDQQIPTTLNRNNLHAEFKYFYKYIAYNIFHLSENDVIKLKTNVRHTSKICSDIKVPYKHQ